MGSQVEERDGDDALQATYVNGARLDEYTLMNRNSTNYWYMESAIIGNVATLVNSSGTIQEGYTYRGYGQATVHSGAGDDETWFTSDDPTATSSALGNPYLFTGRDWDSTISLQYNRARWYAPTPGRWLTPDPLGYADGMSLYEYVRSLPVVSLDALGLWDYNVHHDFTLVASLSEGMSADCARIVAQADNAVDSYTGEIGPAPVAGDLSYHFDVTPNGLRNSPNARFKHYTEHLERAERRCKSGDWQGAAGEFGTGLHPLQDITSHEDSAISAIDGQTHHASTPRRHITGPNAWWRGLGHRPDDIGHWPGQLAKATGMTRAAIRVFLQKCCLCRGG